MRFPILAAVDVATLRRRAEDGEEQARRILVALVPQQPPLALVKQARDRAVIEVAEALRSWRPGVSPHRLAAIIAAACAQNPRWPPDLTANEAGLFRSMVANVLALAPDGGRRGNGLSARSIFPVVSAVCK